MSALPLYRTRSGRIVEERGRLDRAVPIPGTPRTGVKVCAFFHPSGGFAGYLWLHNLRPFKGPKRRYNPPKDIPVRRGAGG